MKHRTKIQKKKIQMLERSVFNTEMKLDELSESFHYRNRRPLIRISKEVLATILVIAEIVFKAFVIYALL